MSKKPSGRKTSRVRRPAASEATPISGSPMDVRLLEQLVKLMSANDLSAVEVRDGDKRVVLQRGAAGSPGQIVMPQMMHAGPAQAAPPAAVPAADPDAGLTPIKSPMVGTFYSSPSPDAKAFVQVGSTVDEETDVCIIEAMKVFNNIKAECRGTIARILVSNGQTVEYGQVLFLVTPA